MISDLLGRRWNAAAGRGLRTSKPSRLRLLVEQLIELRRMRPGAQIRPFPELRNAIVDVLALGRRKNIFHIVFDVDISDARKRWAEDRARTGVAVSLTSYLAQAFARAVAADRRMQAYR